MEITIGVATPVEPYKRAYAAIMALFNNTSIPIEVTLESLEALADELQACIDACRAQIEINQAREDLRDE